MSYSSWVAELNPTEQLNTFTFRGFVKEVAFGQRLEGRVNVGYVALCPNSVPGRDKNKQRPLG